MNFKVIDLTPEYLDETLALYEKCLGFNESTSKSTLLRDFKEKRGIFLIAIDSDTRKVIGLKFGRFENEVAIGCGIAVDPRYRRSGIATAMAREYENRIKKLPHIKKYVFGSATPEGIPFHIRMGYKPSVLLQFDDPNLRKSLDLKGFRITEEGYKEKFKCYQVYFDIDPENQNLKYLIELKKKYPNINIQYVFSKEKEAL